MGILKNMGENIPDENFLGGNFSEWGGGGGNSPGGSLIVGNFLVGSYPDSLSNIHLWKCLFLIKMKFKWLKSKELLPVRANAFYVVPVSFESLMFSNISDHKMKNFIKVSILLEKSFQKHWIKIKT